MITEGPKVQNLKLHIYKCGPIITAVNSPDFGET